MPDVIEKQNGTAVIEFDLSRVTARQMNEFFKATRENNIEAMATFFTQVVKRLPDGRDAKDTETYMAMPFYGEFQDLLEGMTTAAKNVRAR